ncbi:hypothetical protein DFJ73DRAFT_757496 [Zopfochytrium polystomum]|nr:hypothetical protein DFJ73DRAFT_757496 [Zopfochytrium polystomum]
MSGTGGYPLLSQPPTVDLSSPAPSSAVSTANQLGTNAPLMVSAFEAMISAAGLPPFDRVPESKTALNFVPRNALAELPKGSSRSSVTPEAPSLLSLPSFESSAETIESMDMPLSQDSVGSYQAPIDSRLDVISAPSGDFLQPTVPAPASLEPPTLTQPASLPTPTPSPTKNKGKKRAQMSSEDPNMSCVNMSPSAHRKLWKPWEKDVTAVLGEAVDALTTRKQKEDMMKHEETQRQQGKLSQYQAEIRRDDGDSSAVDVSPLKRTLSGLSPRKRRPPQQIPTTPRKLHQFTQNPFSPRNTDETVRHLSERMTYSGMVSPPPFPSEASSWYPHEMLPKLMPVAPERGADSPQSDHNADSFLDGLVIAADGSAQMTNTSRSSPNPSILPNSFRDRDFPPGLEKGNNDINMVDIRSFNPLKISPEDTAREYARLLDTQQKPVIPLPSVPRSDRRKRLISGGSTPSASSPLQPAITVSPHLRPRRGRRGLGSFFITNPPVPEPEQEQERLREQESHPGSPNGLDLLALAAVSGTAPVEIAASLSPLDAVLPSTPTPTAKGTKRRRTRSALSQGGGAGGVGSSSSSSAPTPESHFEALVQAATAAAQTDAVPTSSDDDVDDELRSIELYGFTPQSALLSTARRQRLRALADSSSLAGSIGTRSEELETAAAGGDGVDDDDDNDDGDDGAAVSPSVAKAKRRAASMQEGKAQGGGSGGAKRRRRKADEDVGAVLGSNGGDTLQDLPPSPSPLRSFERKGHVSERSRALTPSKGASLPTTASFGDPKLGQDMEEGGPCKAAGEDFATPPPPPAPSKSRSKGRGKKPSGVDSTTTSSGSGSRRKTAVSVVESSAAASDAAEEGPGPGSPYARARTDSAKEPPRGSAASGHSSRLRRTQRTVCRRGSILEEMGAMLRPLNATKRWDKVIMSACH